MHALYFYCYRMILFLGTRALKILTLYINQKNNFLKMIRLLDRYLPGLNMLHFTFAHLPNNMLSFLAINTSSNFSSYN